MSTEKRAYIVYDRDEMNDKILTYLKEKTGKNGFAKVSQQTMSDDIGISTMYISTSLTKLIKSGILKKQKAVRVSQKDPLYEYKIIGEPKKAEKSVAETKAENAVKETQEFGIGSDLLIDKAISKLRTKNAASSDSIATYKNMLYAFESAIKEDRRKDSVLKQVTKLTSETMDKSRIYYSLFIDAGILGYNMGDLCINKDLYPVDKQACSPICGSGALVVGANVDQNTAVTKMLLDNLMDFKNYQDTFKEFFAESMKQLVPPEPVVDSSAVTLLEEEIVSLNEKLEKGAQTLAKYEDSLQKANESINGVKENCRKLKLVNQALSDTNDHLITFMQERLQVALAEMTNMLSEYIQLPQWKRTAAVNATFQNKLLKTVTSSIDDILANNTNIAGKE